MKASLYSPIFLVICLASFLRHKLKFHDVNVLPLILGGVSFNVMCNLCRKKWDRMESNANFCAETVVVYHSHWQTGRLTVWANGNQNLGVVNFFPESSLPLAEISSIYRMTAAKARKVGYEEMEHEFSCGTFRPEKQNCLLRCSIVLGN